MIKKISLLTVIILATSPLLSQETDDLIISEYVEGSSYNKYIEIYNGTGETVDLTDYKLHIFFNGRDLDKEPSVEIELAEADLLADKETIVIGNSRADLYNSPEIESGNVNFNGNDAVTLFKTSSGSYIDVFGCIGQDPGEAWTATGELITKDMTLQRKASVTTGSTTEDNDTDFNTLEEEWTALANDDVSGLGQHGGTITRTRTPGVTSTILVYPNVSNNRLIVESPEEPAEIRICNFAGKLMMLCEAGDTGRINISGLKPGIYIATVQLEDGTSKSLKFSKK